MKYDDIEEYVDLGVEKMAQALAKDGIELDPDEIDAMRDTLQEILESRLES